MVPKFRRRTYQKPLLILESRNDHKQYQLHTDIVQVYVLNPDWVPVQQDNASPGLGVLLSISKWAGEAYGQNLGRVESPSGRGSLQWTNRLQE